MSLEDNKALVRRFYEEVVNGQRIDLLPEFVRSGFVYHSSEGSASSATGIDYVKQGIASMRAILPDCKAEIEDMTAEDDRVVVRVRYNGTALGRPVALSGTITYRIEGGMLAERWGGIDLSALRMASLSALRNVMQADSPAPEGKSSGLGSPPRALTSKMEDYIAGSGWKVNWGVFVILLVIFLVTDIIVFYQFMSHRIPIKHFVWFFLSLVLTAAIPAGIVLYNAHKRRKLKFILKNGEVAKATIRKNLLNWGMRLNGAPQRIVEMDVAGKPITLKTFDHNLANELPEGMTVEILCHKRYPKTIIPTNCLA